MSAAAVPLLTGLLIGALIGAPSRAQDAPAGSGVASDDATIKQIREKLGENPAFAAMVAKRIDASRLAPAIAPDKDGDDRMKAVSDWVAKDPDSAAHVAVGLYGDDAAGNTMFEDNLLRQMRLSFVDNTKDRKGPLGHLRDAAKNSALLKQQQDKLSDDEKREMIRTLFEGHAASGNVLNTNPGAGGPSGANVPAVGAGGVAAGFAGYYDRLSAANLHGYSPQLMSLQNALNRRRAPGAPMLIETGKLDYATLAYPSYAMDYDVRGLEGRLARDRILELAKLAGVELSAQDLRDPDLEKKLLAKIPADRLPTDLKRRAELAAKARAALQAFLDAAAAAKDPVNISKNLIVGLGRLQQNAARWITAAALEEDAARIDALGDFLTPELRLAIEACPAAPPTRASYLGRGEELNARLASARADVRKASDLLTNDGWQSALTEIDRLASSERAARKTLERDVPVYTRVPYRLAVAAQTQARWRDWVDDMAVKWAPSSSYAKSVSARRARLSRWLGLFLRISGGDLDGAAGGVAALEPATSR